MSFSDDNLTALKAKLANEVPYTTGVHLLYQDARALVERLGAAEWAMSELERHERKGYLHGDLVEPLEAWRASKGEAAGRAE